MELNIKTVIATDDGSEGMKGNVVEVVEDPVLARAQCTIETDTRIFDCSLDVQLKNLISNIKLLSGQ